MGKKEDRSALPLKNPFHADLTFLMWLMPVAVVCPLVKRHHVSGSRTECYVRTQNRLDAIKSCQLWQGRIKNKNLHALGSAVQQLT